MHLQGTQVPAVELRFARRLRRAGVPFALTLHTTFEHRSGWSRRALGALAAEASALFTLTEPSVDPSPAGRAAERVGHGPYDRMPRDPGLDRRGARAALGIDAQAEVVLFLGQIRAYKGLDDLIRAFAQVARARPRAELHLLARPHEPFDRHRARIEALGLTARTRVRLGFFPLEEVLAAVRAADVVALPYREADQSGAAILAIGQGTPVVAASVGGIPDAVPDGGAGFLVRPGDVGALGERLTEVLADPKLRARLARGARKASDALPSWDQIAARTLSAYGLAAEVARR
ncbi:MAG: glycosyltransferase family 4 protein [Actinobacteria bacterium]|nr:glycosyltransferase family 4 protein [Actinomycetota bacterium]